MQTLGEIAYNSECKALSERDEKVGLPKVVRPRWTDLSENSQLVYEAVAEAVAKGAKRRGM